jgi:hypothetical protein
LITLKERMMKRILQDERGMALAVAIFALVVVGALVAGAFFAGTQEQRVGENSRRVEQAFGVADGGLGEVIHTWNDKRLILNALPHYPGTPYALADTASPGATGQYGGTVYKLNNELYLIDLTGRDNMSARAGGVLGGGARQRLGMIVRIRPVQIGIGGALTTQGSVRLTGNAYVDGNDHIPAGWNPADCDPLGDGVAGIRTPDSSDVSGAMGHVSGDPPVYRDPSVSDSTFSEFGDVTYADLAAMADKPLPPGNYRTEPTFLAGGQCNTGDNQNWGDGMNPTAPCGNFFPIIHISGDATLNGVQGQGILLVDGDLEVQGSYEFYGITIVRGRLKTAGGGSTDAHFWGGVMAANVDLELNSLSGNATLNYSQCAIVQALQMTGTTAQLRSRGWVQLY